MGYVVIEVTGLPTGQGSKSAIVRGGHAVIVEGKGDVGRAKHKNWRHDVKAATQLWAAANPISASAMRQAPVYGVDITFYFQRPASYTRKRSWWKNTKPDLDKLYRSVLDALTAGGIIPGDEKVAELTGRKVLVTERPEGATITVTALHHEPEPPSGVTQDPARLLAIR
jgi:Holliday junction resolvase RusA-like endonuclease